LKQWQLLSKHYFSLHTVVIAISISVILDVFVVAFAVVAKRFVYDNHNNKDEMIIISILCSYDEF